MAFDVGGESDSSDDLVSGINITPLVDVVLVLLVIFLMTAPTLYTSAIKVQLPKAKSGDASSAPQKPIRITLNKEDSIHWNDESVTWEALPQRADAFVKSKAESGEPIAETAIQIAADESVSHGRVVRLMDLLRQRGLARFSISVQNSN